MSDNRPEEFVNEAAEPVTEETVVNAAAEMPNAADDMTYAGPKAAEENTVNAAAEEPKAAETVTYAAPEEPKKAAEEPRGYSYNPNPAASYGAAESYAKPKKATWKKVLAGALACLLVAGLGFGGGYLGVKAGYANLEPVVINQIADTTPAIDD